MNGIFTVKILIRLSSRLENKFILKNSKIYPALFSGLLLIGLSPILIKLADAPGIITTFYRMLIGAILLTPVFIIHVIKKKPTVKTKGIVFASLAGLCLGTDMSLWVTGIVASNATLPTLVGNLAPLWVGIGAIVFFKEKQNRGFWSGLAVAIFGIGILIFKDLFQPGATLKGIILGFLAGIFYSGFHLFTQSGRKYLNTLVYLYFSTLATGLTAAIYGIALGVSFTGYSPETWGYWLAMGVGVQVFGWFLINYVQGILPASVVAPTLLGQPIITAIIAILFLGEKFTIWHITGGIVIVIGIYVVHFKRAVNKA